MLWKIIRIILFSNLRYKSPNITNYDNLNRTLTSDEYDEVVNYAYDLGVRNAFIQEEETCLESFIPKFSDEIEIFKKV